MLTFWYSSTVLLAMITMNLNPMSVGLFFCPRMSLTQWLLSFLLILLALYTLICYFLNFISLFSLLNIIPSSFHFLYVFLLVRYVLLCNRHLLFEVLLIILPSAFLVQKCLLFLRLLLHLFCPFYP